MFSLINWALPTVMRISVMANSPNLQLAAVDLGSNSFHLTIARETQGELQLIDRLGEKIQLASGLNERNELSEEVMQRGLACLERFSQRLKGVPPGAIRVVGTNTLRAARNRQYFIRQAQQLLGCPVEVISGREEARLIYLGVAHSFSDDEERRLVVDIGGGSTEFIIGKQFSPIELESLHMGCVSYTRRYFSDGRITSGAFKKAVNAGHQELLSIRRHFRKVGWRDVVGASGTVKAVYQLLNAEQTSNKPITIDVLYDLRDQLIDLKRIDNIQLGSIKEKRAAVIAGGLAILIAIFEAFDIDDMRYSDGALREGLLYDHIGRLRHEDVRERTIAALMERYHVDVEHALLVDATASTCLKQIGLDGEACGCLLSWACRLHESGMAISHSQYHKHGGYLVQNSDLMGFSQTEQLRLALLVCGHRRKLPLLSLDSLGDKARKKLLSLMVVLRLSVLLNRSRNPELGLDFKLSLDGENGYKLRFAKGWLDQHPLTLADLQQEAGYLKTAKISLAFK